MAPSWRHEGRGVERQALGPTPVTTSNSSRDAPVETGRRFSPGPGLPAAAAAGARVRRARPALRPTPGSWPRRPSGCRRSTAPPRRPGAAARTPRSRRCPPPRPSAAAKRASSSGPAPCGTSMALIFTTDTPPRSHLASGYARRPCPTPPRPTPRAAPPPAPSTSPSSAVTGSARTWSPRGCACWRPPWRARAPPWSAPSTTWARAATTPPARCCPTRCCPRSPGTTRSCSARSATPPCRRGCWSAACCCACASSSTTT